MALGPPSPSTPVCVTGASSGICAELARALAQRGHALLLVARRRDRLEALGEELVREHGVEVEVHPADLGDREGRQGLLERLGRDGVGGLCNNAGFGSHGRLLELDPAKEAQMIELNVVAVHELTLGVLPALVGQGHGAVLNVASLAAFQPLPRMATYAATKAFVQSFSEAVHAELAGTGVSVTALCPGPVPTEFGKVAGVGAFDEDRGLPKPISMDAPDVAEAAVRGMVRGARSVVPGVTWKATATAGRLVPRSALLPAFKRAARYM
jgi:uncharacterized protein